MLGYLLIAEEGNAVLELNELDSIKWFTFDEALEAIRKDSTAEAFLKSALAEIKKF
jgi:NADH pyrophosphatase NudC (nudix superfamily)